MTRAGLLACVLALIACAGPRDVSSRAERPANAVVILADDMGWGDVSAYGADAWVQTPNIDALAAEGTLYTAAYAMAPVCGPSRVGLLTGNEPARYGVSWNPDTLRTFVPETRPLLTDLARAAGYRTAVVGKWNLANPAEDHADVVRDEMMWGGSYWPDADGVYAGVGGGYGAGGKASGLWGPERAGDEYLTDRLTQHGVEFIEEGGERPFLLYLAYNAPHSPLEAHERHRAATAHLPTEPQRLYAAMVLAVDDGVGRITEALARAGVADDTLIVFTSDNGPAETGFRGHRAGWPRLRLGETGPYSGSKGTFREGGIRVPMIARWPGRLRTGVSEDAPVTHADLYRTMAGVTPGTVPGEAGGAGRDLSAPSATRPLSWIRDGCGRSGACVLEGARREGRYKLLVRDGEPAQLFDLTDDPSEANDLAASEPERHAAMLAAWHGWRRTLPSPASKGTDRLVIAPPDAPVRLDPVLSAPDGAR